MSTQCSGDVTAPPSPRVAGGTSFRPDVFTLQPLRLHGMRCGRCRQVSFPTRESCPSCGSPDDLQQRPLSARGVLCSWSVVRNAPAGLRTPYTLAYVDLPDDGVRVMSRLSEADGVELVVGLPLELTAIAVDETRAEPSSDADSPYMFAFRPARKDSR